MKNQTKKQWIRCFSFLLSLLMIFGAVPIYAEPLAPAAAPAERETNIDESVISEEICFEELLTLKGVLHHLLFQY